MSNILRLVKHKTWFIPGNAATYKTLTALGFPTTRIHEDAIGILKLVLSKKGIQARVEPFSAIRDKFYDAAGEWWHAKGGRAQIKQTTLSFRIESSDPNRKLCEKLKDKISEFRDRWGLCGDVTISELKNTLKVHFEIGKAIRNPMLRTKVKAEQEKRAILELGNFRISTATDSQFFFWRVEVKCGSEWKHQFQSKCLLTEVSDPAAFLGNLMIAFNNDFDHDRVAARDRPLVQESK